MSNFYGVIHSGLETLTGSVGDDQFYPVGGWDLVLGSGGVDTVFIVDTSNHYSITNAGNINYVDAVSGASASQVQMKDIDFIQYLDKKVALWNNSQIHSTLSNETFIGGSSLYSVIYPSASQNFNVQLDGYEAHVTPKTQSKTAATPTQVTSTFQDDLQYISRLIFSDVGICLDLNAGQSGAESLNLLNALLGADGVKNPANMATALNYFDAGHSMSQACSAALSMGVISTNPTEFVQSLWLHVMGSPIDANNLNSFVAQLLLQPSLNQAESDLLNMAATSSFNMSQVQLLGVLHTGVQYTLSH